MSPETNKNVSRYHVCNLTTFGYPISVAEPLATGRNEMNATTTAQKNPLAGNWYWLISERLYRADLGQWVWIYVVEVCNAEADHRLYLVREVMSARSWETLREEQIQCDGYFDLSSGKDQRAREISRVWMKESDAKTAAWLAQRAQKVAA
jgi:hypothetical protein